MKRSATYSLFFILGLCTFSLAAEPAPNKLKTKAKSDAGGPPVTVANLLDRALRSPQLPSANELYRATVLKHGNLDEVFKRLVKLAPKKDAKGVSLKQSNALWLTAHLQWRHGDLTKALETAALLAKLDKDAKRKVAAQLVQAKLLDATGKSTDARKQYETVLKATHDAQVKNLVQLRLAMLNTSTKTSVELAKYAKARPKDKMLRNRAAVVLGLLNRPQDAIKLFQVGGQGTARFKQEARLAEWALAAKKWKDAQKFAWAARNSAKLSRDRRYANTLLVEAYRAAKQIPKLIARFKKEKNIDNDSRKLWVALLRETGKVDDALKLFRTSKKGQFTAEMRRELLELCREADKEALLIKTYKELIQQEPKRIVWREGLSRYHLEKGERKKAVSVWRQLLGQPDSKMLLPAASAAMALGLEDVTTEFAERCIKNKDGHFPALLMLFEMHRKRGRTEKAIAALDRMDKLAAPNAGQRMQLAEAYEQIGRQDRAVTILEALRKARGPENMAEDLEMHLAWLHSEVGNEEKALTRWKELWLRVESVGRRRYIEDRLMSVASRLGKLADIAIEIEERLADGKATARDSGLLVQLYTKAGDPVSAAEITEEYMKQTGGNPVKVLVEKARIYVACHDYFNYEKTIRQLIKVDAENTGDYLRQLAMSHLERGKRNEARDVLLQLKAVEGGSDSAEFEAGVLALAGMRKDAIIAYRKGIARYPDRIDTYLLLAKIMKEIGQNKRAIGMFQYLAETAEKDDLFTIAIDGLLNAEAPRAVVSWARRITLERLTRRHDKMYLYQLITDLSEETRDRRMMLRAQAAALPIAGERRISQLRELMDLAKTARQSKERLRFGRRLISLGDIVPPNVYLDLGAAFLASGDVKNAAKTFSLASDLPDYAAYQRKIAQEFEKARYLAQALRSYERVIVGESTDAKLLSKIGELHEQLGRDDLANGLFLRGIDLIISRQPLEATKDTKLSKARNTSPFFYFSYNRNVDEYGQYYSRILKGFLATLTSDTKQREKMLSDEFAKIQTNIGRVKSFSKDETKRRLAKFPRLIRRADFYRRLAIATKRTELLDKVDLELLKSFPQDNQLLPALCRIRMHWGLVRSAQGLIAKAKSRSAKEIAAAHFVAGSPVKSTPGAVTPTTAGRLFMPMLVEGRDDQVRELLQRVHITTSKQDLAAVPTLFSAAVYLGDKDMVLDLGRRWANLLFKSKDNTSVYQVTTVLQRCIGILDKRRREALLQYVTNLVGDNPRKGVQLIYWLQQYSRNSKTAILDRKKIEQMMLKQLESGYSYSLPPMFRLLKPEDRSATLRFVWPKIAKSQRAYFLVQLASNLTDKIDEGFEQLIVDSLKDSFAESANKQIFPYYVRSIVVNKENPNKTLAARILEIMVKLEPNSISYLSLHAVALKRANKMKEAIAALRRAYAKSLTLGNKTNVRNFYDQQALRTMLDEFLPKHIDEFLSELDKYAKGGGSRTTITRKRMELLGQQSDPEKLVAAYEAAIKKYPKDMSLYGQYEMQLRRLGRNYDRIKLLERMAKLNPKSTTYKTRLASAWRALKHPLNADKARPKGKAGARVPRRPGRRPGRRVVPGVRMSPLIPLGGIGRRIVRAANSLPRTAAKGAKGKKKKFKLPARMPYASISSVKRYVDRGEMKMGQLMYRSVWRNFRYLDNRYGYVYIPSMGGRGLLWGSTFRRRSRNRANLRKGGLAEFFVRPVPRKKPQSAYLVLAEKPFGPEELKRQLRSMTAAEMEGANAGTITDGVAKALSLKLGSIGAIESALQSIESGKASRSDYLLLLALLAQDAAHQEAARKAAKNKPKKPVKKPQAAKKPKANKPAKAAGKKPVPAIQRPGGRPTTKGAIARRSARKPVPQVKKPRPYKPIPAATLAKVRKVVADLTRTMNPRESGQLRRLAHFMALKSSGDQATRLYRWCGTFASMTPYSRDPNVIPIQPLVDEIISVLKGKNRDDALDSVFRFSAPASTDYYRDQYDFLVLDTWSKVLGPGKALAKCRDICIATNDRDGPIRRRAALYAARMLAQGGELATAEKCLETALCKDVVNQSRFYFGNTYAPRLSNLDMERLFPGNAKDWKDRGKWFTRAAKSLMSWHAKGRLDPRSTIKVLAIAAWRQHEAGEKKAALETLEYVAKANHLYERDRLWASDVARKIGAHDVAIRMEMKQLTERRLLLERVPDLIAEIEKHQGAQKALLAAEDATQYTLHPLLVNHLIRLTKSADKKRHVYWTSIKKKYYTPKPRPKRKPLKKGVGKPRGVAPGAKKAKSAATKKPTVVAKPAKKKAAAKPAASKKKPTVAKPEKKKATVKPAASEKKKSKAAASKKKKATPKKSQPAASKKAAGK